MIIMKMIDRDAQLIYFGHQGGKWWPFFSSSYFVIRSRPIIIIILYTQQTQNIFITFVQRQPNVFDVGPTLYKCYKNVLCLLGVASIKTMEMTEEIFVFAVGLEVGL